MGRSRLTVGLALALAGLIGGLSGPSVVALAVGKCGTYKTFGNEVLTASDLNNSLIQAATTNGTPQCLDTYSATVSQMRITTDPFPANTESLATTLAGELERLRFEFQQIHGQTYWYSRPSPLQPPGDIWHGAPSVRTGGAIFYHQNSGFSTGLFSGQSTQSTSYFLPAAPPTAANQVLSVPDQTTLQMSWATGVTAGVLNNVQVFTANGTWTKTAGTTKVIIEVIAGGGGGGGAPLSGVGEAAAGGGGGGGGYAWKFLDVTAIASSTITVGAGGAGGVAGANPGSTGGTSSWADGTNTISATGGSGGVGNAKATVIAPLSAGGVGGLGSGGTVNLAGGDGGYGVGYQSAGGGLGGAGGTTPLGMQASAVNSSTGVVGKNYGGGGSGGGSGNSGAVAGGNGAPGLIVVLEFK